MFLFDMGRPKIVWIRGEFQEVPRYVVHSGDLPISSLLNACVEAYDTNKSPYSLIKSKLRPICVGLPMDDAELTQKMLYAEQV